MWILRKLDNPKGVYKMHQQELTKKWKKTQGEHVAWILLQTESCPCYTEWQTRQSKHVLNSPRHLQNFKIFGCIIFMAFSNQTNGGDILGHNYLLEAGKII